jgi:hypothetical protein
MDAYSSIMRNFVKRRIFVAASAEICQNLGSSAQPAALNQPAIARRPFVESRLNRTTNWLSRQVNWTRFWIWRTGRGISHTLLEPNARVPLKLVGYECKRIICYWSFRSALLQGEAYGSVLVT